MRYICQYLKFLILESSNSSVVFLANEIPTVYMKFALVAKHTHDNKNCTSFFSCGYLKVDVVGEWMHKGHTERNARCERFGVCLLCRTRFFFSSDHD